MEKKESAGLRPTTRNAEKLLLGLEKEDISATAKSCMTSDCESRGEFNDMTEESSEITINQLCETLSKFNIKYSHESERNKPLEVLVKNRANNWCLDHLKSKDLKNYRHVVADGKSCAAILDDADLYYNKKNKQITMKNCTKKLFNDLTISDRLCVLQEQEQNQAPKDAKAELAKPGQLFLSSNSQNDDTIAAHDKFNNID